jgi:hypothetical protein
MDPVKRIVLRLKLRKTEGTIVHHNALLSRSIKDSKLVAGYALCMNQACWHCWVEGPDGTKYDVTREIVPFEYSTEVPEGYQQMSHELIDKNIELFKLYTDDRKQFWKDAPKSVRDFK